MRSSSPFLLLLAEDNEDDVTFFRHCFREFEPAWRMEWVSDGAKALEFCQQNGFPHMIVTDLNMPLVDGLELIRRCRAHPDGGRIPILAHSSFCDPGSPQACRDAGADGIGIKGCPMKEIQNVLRELMRKVESIAWE